MEFVMVLLAVAMGMGGMYLYLVDFIGCRTPKAPAVKAFGDAPSVAPSIDITREP